ncbi:disulfide bond formation protein B [Pseudoroseomonas wenyumeiae]
MPLLIAILAATAPLAAMATERWGGLNPCLLCLWQRWPYWVAAVLALLAYLLPRRLMLALAGLAILTSGAFAVVHLGVEAKWWPSPLPGCVAPNASAGQSVEEMLASLSPPGQALRRAHLPRIRPAGLDGRDEPHLCSGAGRHRALGRAPPEVNGAAPAQG